MFTLQGELIVSPGMTNANMKLVTVDVPFPDKLETYEQKLDAGEFIVKRVVEIAKLAEEFKGDDSSDPHFREANYPQNTEYEKKGYVVDAKLAHLAAGWELAHKLAKGQVE